MIKNIRNAFLSATDEQYNQGMDWYTEANLFAEKLASEHGKSIEHAAAVIAHLSPRIRWGRNIIAAELAFKRQKASGIMSAPYGRAIVALDSEDPIATINGQKTNAFAHNIIGDYSKVTVDVWAIACAFGRMPNDKEQILNKTQYNQIAYCYEYVAKQFKITPAQMQAICWVVTRGKAQ